MNKFFVLKVILIGVCIGELCTAKVLSIQNNINDNLLLNGSKKFQSWIESSEVENNLEFCIFNVTNPEAILEGDKPVLKEICGFGMIQKKQMKVIGWQDDEKYVVVELNTDYESKKMLSDPIITTLNVPLVYLHSWLDKSVHSQALRELINKSLKKSLFINKKASELLFTGYDNEMLIFLEKILQKTHFPLSIPTRVHEAGIYSFVDHKKSVYSAIWTVNTGKFDLKDLGQVELINGQSRTNAWKRPCNLINGTDGVVHNPLVNEMDSLSVYVPEMNRSIQYIYDPEISDDDIKSFTLSKNTFASGESFSPNQCYTFDSNEINQHDGILRMPISKDSALPITYSLPRFQYADEFIANQVEIIKTAVDSQSFFDVQKSGDVHLRKINLQVNLDTNSVSKALNLERMIFPIYWSEDWSFGKL